jgi:AcrR family transcriptional regulator
MTTPRKPQERTAVTRDRLIEAAEQVFSQCGYEKSQLAEIAEVAGFSKGALYAHFKSKEDLFFALARAKATSYQLKLRQALEKASTREAKIDAFRRFYLQLSDEKRWALIILEMKLFVTRYPEVKDRLRRAEDELADSVEQAFVELFGKKASAAGKALGGIFSALVLEGELEPSVLTDPKIKMMLAAVFDTLAGLNKTA